MRPTHVAALAVLAAVSLNAAALANAAAPPDGGVGDQRIICKKHVETGSLVRKVKRCFTKDEWDQVSEAEQRGVKRMIEELTSRPNMAGGN
jgi:hypothetical protein